MIVANKGDDGAGDRVKTHESRDSSAIAQLIREILHRGVTIRCLQVEAAATNPEIWVFRRNVEIWVFRRNVEIWVFRYGLWRHLGEIASVAIFRLEARDQFVDLPAFFVMVGNVDALQRTESVIVSEAYRTISKLEIVPGLWIMNPGGAGDSRHRGLAHIAGL